MDWLITGLQAALMGVVEGITEYLPISSTGHLILLNRWLGDPFNHNFEVVIQSGAVLAVLVEYWHRFIRLAEWRKPVGFAGLRGLSWLALTTLPAALLGLLCHSQIKACLFAPGVVALALGVGGGVMIALERWLPAHDDGGVDALGWKRALGIGCFQCLAMIPGTSRSMATILGGRLLGLSRKTAAEYSFFAAVPILLLAGAYSLWSDWSQLSRTDILPYAIGLLISFLIARGAIRFLMRLIIRHTFAAFGWYRIALSLLLWTVMFRNQLF